MKAGPVCPYSWDVPVITRPVQPVPAGNQNWLVLSTRCQSRIAAGRKYQLFGRRPSKIPQSESARAKASASMVAAPMRKQPMDMRKQVSLCGPARALFSARGMDGAGRGPDSCLRSSRARFGQASLRPRLQ